LKRSFLGGLAGPSRPAGARRSRLWPGFETGARRCQPRDHRRSPCRYSAAERLGIDPVRSDHIKPSEFAMVENWMEMNDGCGAVVFEALPLGRPAVASMWLISDVRAIHGAVCSKNAPAAGSRGTHGQGVMRCRLQHRFSSIASGRCLWSVPFGLRRNAPGARIL
jgi:hypothetical protein